MGQVILMQMDFRVLTLQREVEKQLFHFISATESTYTQKTSSPLNTL